MVDSFKRRSSHEASDGIDNREQKRRLGYSSFRYGEQFVAQQNYRGTTYDVFSRIARSRTTLSIIARPL